jgi:hypothetical protein
VSSRFSQQFHCGFPWPPYSPDINPCDYFLWGYPRDKMFSSAPRTLPESRIKESCAQVTRGMLTLVVLYRTLYCVFKLFYSPKGLTSSMSSTTLPIREILILVCYFDAVFI